MNIVVTRYKINTQKSHASYTLTMKSERQVRDMEQETGSKSGKEYIKAVYGHPVCLTYMQST